MGYSIYLISLLALFTTLVFGMLHGLGCSMPVEAVEVLVYGMIPVTMMAGLSTGKLRPGYCDLLGGCSNWAIVLAFALLVVDFAYLSGHDGGMSFAAMVKPSNLPVAVGLMSSQYYWCACTGYSNR